MSVRATATSVPYSEQYYSDRHASSMFRVETRYLCSLLNPKPGERILEVGCGGGALLELCKECGAEPVGLDTNQRALRLVRKHESSATVVQANGLTLPVEDNSFDGVVGQHIIEHFDDGDALLREWHRVLRPGGRVVLVTPNAKYPDPDLFYDPDHRLIYSKTDLVDLLGRTGFVVECWYTLAPYLGNRRLTSKAAPWLLGLRHVPFFAERGSALHVMARKPVLAIGRAQGEAR